MTSAATEPLTAQDRERVGMLLHFALDQLWMQSPDSAGEGADPLDHLGCCPQCCAPCHVIWELSGEGRLDGWVRWWPESLAGTSWWDEQRSRVDVDWLERTWAGSRDGRLGCSCDLDE